MSLNISAFEPMGEYRLRAMELFDVAPVVRVHMSSFVNFFLTFLGPAFLKELYKGTIADPSGIAIVAESNGGIYGFVTGTVASSGFYHRLIVRRWWRFGLASVTAVIKRPAIVPRLLRAFTMPRQTADKQDRGTLMSIAVSPDGQGKGIGRVLALAFLREAVRRGVKQVDLTTDATGNEVVNRFYENLGFVCEREYTTPEGRMMKEYVIKTG